MILVTAYSIQNDKLNYSSASNSTIALLAPLLTLEVKMSMPRRVRRGGDKRDVDSNTLELECSLCKVR